TITYPPANASISSNTVQLTGTATEDAGGSGITLTQVEVSTGLGGSKAYWTGSTWTAPASQTWITTTTAPTWAYSLVNGAGLASGNLFYLRLRLIDVAGNTFTSQTSTFTYDTTAPVVVISTPTDNGGYSTVKFSTPFAGTATDNGTNPTGVSTVT